jgi:circadian clock protein KaiC
MAAIGLDLGQWVARKRLVFSAARPTQWGLELHLALMHKHINDCSPDAVVIDPISNFGMLGDNEQVKSMLMRLVDFLKGRQITCLFTNLTMGGSALELTEAGVSPLVDTWLVLRQMERNGGRHREIYVVKSRGMAHSSEVRDFVITRKGIKLADADIDVARIHADPARDARDASKRARMAMGRQKSTPNPPVASRKRG